jgi:hypothetical protein
MAEHGDPTIPANLHCTLCNRETTFSAGISVILVFAPGLKVPYPLIAAEGYRVCTHVEIKDGKKLHCDSVFNMVDRAQDAHPTTRMAGGWTRAVVVLNDGNGIDVRNPRSLPVAQA